MLDAQLELYERYGAGWSLWTYKDVGLQGLVYADADSPYMRRFGEFIAKKSRLGIDSWGSTDRELPELVEPIHAFIAARVPGLGAVPVERALDRPTTSCATSCSPRRCCPRTPSASAGSTTRSSTRWRTRSGSRVRPAHAAVRTAGDALGGDGLI